MVPTYPVPPADRNPMFLEKRVYQGSPAASIPTRWWTASRTSSRPGLGGRPPGKRVRASAWILPEIGGRIHVGLDRTNGYDFFYRQNVIKPALVGCWARGSPEGVEFNWPQHHRPSTFMPVDWAIESLADGDRPSGAREHEPMGRMKGMHGVTPASGLGACRGPVRLFNRTRMSATFLWWANVAHTVHERYQSFFPAGRQVRVRSRQAGGYRRFPSPAATYYGVDYGPAARTADLSWYRTFPSRPGTWSPAPERFLRGLRHGRTGRLCALGRSPISPGKKQWTWGNGDSATPGTAS